MAIADWFTGFDRDEYERGLAADQANAALSAKWNAEGKMSDADYALSQEHYQVAMGYDPDAEIGAAWDEGLKEGSGNVTSFLSAPFKIVGTALGAVLKALPWWLWIIGLAALAFYLWPVIGPRLAARSK